MTEEQAQEGPPRGEAWRRRSVIAGLAGTGLAATTFGAARWLQDGDDGALPATARRAAASPADAGGFANRDESYANAGGAPARTSATVAEPTTLFPTAAEAAAAATPAAPTILDPSDPVVHLLRRTTFGPTPELVADVHAVGIDAWIAGQLDPASIPDPGSELAWSAFPLATADPATIRSSVERFHWDAMMDYGKATLACQAWSRRQLFEVMVDFWSNHLNVPTPGAAGWDVGCSYQHGVIRPNALGSFTEMLVAAGRHPAMLRYLTAEESTKDSVNENYGRELLELHTVGVASGYTEADVRNSAYILTGRGVVGRDGPGEEGSFVYEPENHWVGPVTVLDFRHDNGTAEGGMEVGDAYLRHLAAHPATAQTIARKLAVRFVSDVPPPALVERLAEAYLDGGTAITPVLDVMFRSVEFWSAVGQKTRRPLENITASVRTLGVAPDGDIVHSTETLYNRAYSVGQRPVSWPAPNGFPDVHAAWQSAGSIVESWNTHRMLVGDWEDGLTRPDPRGLVSGQPAGTVGEYVDSLCRRLCFQTFQPPHRDALVAFLGGDPAAPIDDVADHDLEAAAALVLDSPYFSLR